MLLLQICHYQGNEVELRLSLSVALVSRFKGLSRATAVRLRGCGLCKQTRP